MNRAAVVAGLMLVAAGALFLHPLRNGEPVDASGLLFAAWAMLSGVGVVLGQRHAWVFAALFAIVYAMIGVIGGALCSTLLVAQATGAQHVHELNDAQLRLVTVTLWLVAVYAVGVLALLLRPGVRAYCVRGPSTTATASA